MELEHRSPKSRYLRTSRKDFEKQLGCIERRQARIRRIRQKLVESTKNQEVLIHEKGPESAALDYHIGKTQNHPLDLGTFAQQAGTDPAAKVFYITVFVTIKVPEIDFRNSQKISKNTFCRESMLGSRLLPKTQNPAVQILHSRLRSRFL